MLGNAAARSVEPRLKDFGVKLTTNKSHGNQFPTGNFKIPPTKSFLNQLGSNIGYPVAPVCESPVRFSQQNCHLPDPNWFGIILRKGRAGPPELALGLMKIMSRRHTSHRWANCAIVTAESLARITVRTAKITDRTCILSAINHVINDRL